MIQYSNTKGVETRQREAIGFLLSGIKESEGYQVTLGTVYFSLASRFQDGTWPACIVLNAGGKGEFGATNSQDFEATYDLLIFKQPESTSGEEDANLWRENTLTAVKTAIGLNPGLMGEDERLTARLAWVSSFKPLYKLLGQEYIGIHIQITVRYGNDTTDPTQFV